MSDGEIVARHYATGETVRVQWRARRFTEFSPVKTDLPDNLWIAPPLFDLQINGYAGVDFQQDNLPLGDLELATRKLRADGCGKFLLTLITDEWNTMMARLRHLRSLRHQSDELKSAIVGWHIEGPFLSAEPGFCGAHNPTVMLDPKPEHMHELRRIAEGDPLLITIAPERAGALDAIKLAVSQGIKVSLGHTNASAEALRQAVAAGATGFTHLANGCPRELDRHDNILWRVFETPGLLVSLIPDQIHVSPPFFRLAHRTLGSDSIYYTTDAMAAAGSPPGRYRIGKLEVEVGADQIVRQPGGPLFAGSALRPIEGVFRAARMLGCPWQETWKRLSEAPARLMGLRNEVVGGAPADFCLLKWTQQNALPDLDLHR
jgi:N-acetylglucosamine-6-phosphate deacetylase